MPLSPEDRDEVRRIVADHSGGPFPPYPWPFVRRSTNLKAGSIATLLRSRVFSFDEFDGSVLDPRWVATVAGTGSVNMVNGYRGGIVRLRDSGAAGANDAEIANGLFLQAAGAGFPIWAAAVQHGVIAAASGIRTQAGLRLAAVAFGGNGTYIGFAFDSAAVGANFLCWYANAGAPTVFDTGVPVPLGGFTDLMMKWNPDGTVTFSIDGVPVHTTAVGATVPAAATRLEPYFAVDDGGLAAVGCNFDVDFYYLEQTREP